MSYLRSGKYLPNELLLVIFDFLDNDDLCRLITVSIRFRHLSLIVYFAKRNVAVSPRGQIDLPNPAKTKEMLPLIPKARFVTSINRLSCGLHHPPKSLLQSISDLTAVLRRVESVAELTIDFLTTGESWTPALIRQANAGNALVKGLTELFTAAARVSHSIIVRNGASLRLSLQKAEKVGMLRRKLSSSFSPVSRMFSPPKELKRKSSIHQLVAATNDAVRSSLPASFPTKGAVKVFKINSIILLSQPLLDWSIQTLNCNDITDLTFGNIDFRSVDWSFLLPQIHIPALKSLAFRGYTPFNDLVNFLARHETVTSLTVNNIDFEDWGHPSSLTDPSPSTPFSPILENFSAAFSNIKRLSCCPQGLVSLLSDALHPTDPEINLFPNLRAVTVLWSLGIGQQFRASVVGDTLAPIADKLKACEKAVFVVVYRVDLGSAWSACPPPLSIPRPANSLYRSGTLLNTSHIPLNHDIPAIMSNSPVSPETLSSLFAAFTEIRLDVTPRADRDGIPGLTKALAEVFTHIRHFKVEMHSRAGRPTHENHMMKLHLCHNILKQFKHLRAVYIDGVRSKVVQKQG
ncbi:hypothetical protein D9756_009007 [Leucocoprinus leucothites]|uniref:F-box domain-containing protein n=1 Tax=Leucocoprinus leucothites TaxID=201217 RepID=A0A8H5CWZ6_9AGAR|nr:hypothetical protein D9756_009007 [Leucoagaricus leucothites]